MTETTTAKDAARELIGKLAAMTESERELIAARIGSVVNPSGHVLTMTNAAFLFMQCGREDLTMVAGFRQWLNAGRAVRKGQHTIGYIRVPLTGKRKAAETPEDEAARMAMLGVAVDCWRCGCAISLNHELAACPKCGVDLADWSEAVDETGPQDYDEQEPPLGWEP